MQRRLAQAALPQAPIYRPTAAQFADPIAYIASIHAEGSAAGIVQIIPPAGESGGAGANARAPCGGHLTESSEAGVAAAFAAGEGSKKKAYA